jgi:hypothetical protein
MKSREAVRERAAQQPSSTLMTIYAKAKTKWHVAPILCEECAMYEDEEQSRSTISMRTLRLTVKWSLFGLFGIMVSAALCFSSTVPSFLRLAQEDGTVAKRAAVPASEDSVLPTDTPRRRATTGSRRKVLASKPMKQVDRPAESKDYTKSMAPHAWAEPTQRKNAVAPHDANHPEYP